MDFIKKAKDAVTDKAKDVKDAVSDAAKDVKDKKGDDYYGFYKKGKRCSH